MGGLCCLFSFWWPAHAPRMGWAMVPCPLAGPHALSCFLQAHGPGCMDWWPAHASCMSWVAIEFACSEQAPRNFSYLMVFSLSHSLRFRNSKLALPCLDAQAESHEIQVPRLSLFFKKTIAT